MKKVLLALVAFATVSAYAQQDTTGCVPHVPGKSVKCFVTNLGEAGNQAGYVIFNLRAGSSALPAAGCLVGEVENAPCVEGKVPQWLKDLANAFGGKQASPPDTSNYP